MKRPEDHLHEHLFILLIFPWLTVDLLPLHTLGEPYLFHAMGSKASWLSFSFLMYNSHPNVHCHHLLLDIYITLREFRTFESVPTLGLTTFSFMFSLHSFQACLIFAQLILSNCAVLITGDPFLKRIYTDDVFTRRPMQDEKS